jgi:hypothetical protein
MSKSKLAKPFLTQLNASLQKLDSLTNHPIEVNSEGNAYFYSSKDNKKTYPDAKKFCQNWGGDLFSIKSKFEYKQVA